jgi:hypothetical protein
MLSCTSFARCAPLHSVIARQIDIGRLAPALAPPRALTLATIRAPTPDQGFVGRREVWRTRRMRTTSPTMR